VFLNLFEADISRPPADPSTNLGETADTTGEVDEKSKVVASKYKATQMNQPCQEAMRRQEAVEQWIEER
jgi:hypothetical protein